MLQYKNKSNDVFYATMQVEPKETRYVSEAKLSLSPVR